MTNTPEPNDDELLRRLEAYASARLSPDVRSAAAARARILSEAEFALSRDRPGGAVSPRRASIGRRLRPVLLAAAVGSTLVVGGVAFAADAGGPLYSLRVWWETATLPGAPDARTDAEIGRLDARLAELRVAVEMGYGNAAGAAAAAYRGIVDEAIRGAAGDDRREMILENALNRHIEVLTELLDKVPAQARDAIQGAIGRSGEAIDRIGKPKPAEPAEPTPGGKPDGTPGPQVTDDPPGQQGKPESSGGSGGNENNN